MAEVKLEAKGDGAQWGGQVLDELIAPKCSTLTECLAPDILEHPNYSGSFFLNHLFQGRVADKPKSLIAIFLRRLRTAVEEYRAGREQMLLCIQALRHSNAWVRCYARALTHYESAVSNAYLALMAHSTIIKSADPRAAPPFETDDGSPADRLNGAYNALKHFDSNIVEGHVSDVIAPMWLVNDGLEYAGSRGASKLRFEEFVTIMRDLEDAARFLSEEMFRLAAKERAANS